MQIFSERWWQGIVKTSLVIIAILPMKRKKTHLLHCIHNKDEWFSTFAKNIWAVTEKVITLYGIILH